MTEVERLRQNFKPEPIRTLFIGESPPHGGNFFYQADSRLYRAMEKAFGGRPDFLAWFKSRGYFLDDLVLHPINKIKDKRERRKQRLESVVFLAQRLAYYKPAAVVVVMCAIEPEVRDAMRRGGVPQSVPIYVTPFPSFGNQKRFQAKMVEIISRLPSN
jgi:hypothetical protein